MNAREPDAMVSAYKRLLGEYLDRRPSGTRKKLAAALGKHKSFVTQIANPAYPAPLPARHIGTLFELCHFSREERRTFLRAYAAAHPRRSLDANVRETPAEDRVERITIEVPVLADATHHARLIATIKALSSEAIALAQAAPDSDVSSGDSN